MKVLSVQALGLILQTKWNLDFLLISGSRIHEWRISMSHDARNWSESDCLNSFQMATVWKMGGNQSFSQFASYLS
jgi:hypothetical protein